MTWRRAGKALAAAGLGLVALMGSAAVGACDWRPDDEAQLRRELAQASREARRRLPLFWAHLSAPSEQEFDFRLKVRLKTTSGPGETAEVWVEEIHRKGDGAVSARLAQTSPDLAPLQGGDEVVFEETAITDWGFFRKEDLLGHYTTRVLLPRLPSDQAEVLRSVLSDDPLGDESAQAEVVG